MTWIVWVLAGVGVAGLGLGVWLFVRAQRMRRGRAASILGSVVLVLAALVLLGCYLPVFVLPDVAAESAVFIQPAPVDASATVYFISSADVDYGTPSIPIDTLIAVAARTGAMRWQHALPGTRSQVAVEGNVAYVATLQSLTAGPIMVAAYRGGDGALLWQATIAGSLPHAELAVAGDRVYVLTAMGSQTTQAEIVALRAADGAQVWSTEISEDTSGLLPSLIAAPDAVYLSTRIAVETFSADNGRLLWTRTQLSSNPVVAAGVAYLPLSGGGFAAVHARDGSAICQAGGNLVATLAALDGDSLYLAGFIQGSPSESPPYPSAIYAYDAATCTPRWHAGYVASDLIASGGNVYMIAADSGTVTGVRAGDGKVLWHSGAVTSTLSGMGWRFSTQPVLLGTTLFATSGVMGGGIHVFGGYGWVHLYAFGGHSGFNYWHEPIGHRTRFSSHLTY